MPDGGLDVMADLFLCGPLAEPEILRIVVGPDVDSLKTQPAALPGYALFSSDTAWFPSLVMRAGERVEGLLLTDAPTHVADRITFLMHGVGAAPRNAALASGAAAMCFVADDAPQKATDWQATTWRAKWGLIAQAACQEIMGYVGRIDQQGLTWRMSMILARAGARASASVGAPADLRSDTGTDQVEVTSVETPHQGFFLTREYALQHPQFDGGTSDVLRREVFVVSDAAIVLPYDPRRDRVLLVEQFRMGPFGRGDPKPWALEPVAGRVDAGETPEQTAYRECIEETGLHLSGLERISSHYCSPGCSTEYFHVFLGLCDLPDEGRTLGGLDSEAEDIRSHVIPFERAMVLLESGEANNGPLVLSLIWLSKERERLRAIA